MCHPHQVEAKKEDKVKKGGEKKGRGKESRAGRKEAIEELPQAEPVEATVHPLLEPLEQGAGHQLLMPGNMALVHLTLSRTYTHTYSCMYIHTHTHTHTYTHHTHV